MTWSISFPVLTTMVVHDITAPPTSLPVPAHLTLQAGSVSTYLELSVNISQGCSGFRLAGLSAGLSQALSHILHPLTQSPGPFQPNQKGLCPCTLCSHSHCETVYVVVTTYVRILVFLVNYEFAWKRNFVSSILASYQSSWILRCLLTIF